MHRSQIKHLRRLIMIIHRFIMLQLTKGGATMCKRSPKIVMEHIISISYIPLMVRLIHLVRMVKTGNMLQLKIGNILVIKGLRSIHTELIILTVGNQLGRVRSLPIRVILSESRKVIKLLISAV